MGSLKILALMVLSVGVLEVRGQCTFPTDWTGGDDKTYKAADVEKEFVNENTQITDGVSRTCDGLQDGVGDFLSTVVAFDDGECSELIYNNYGFMFRGSTGDLATCVSDFAADREDPVFEVMVEELTMGVLASSQPDGLADVIPIDMVYSFCFKDYADNVLQCDANENLAVAVSLGNQLVWNPCNDDPPDPANGRPWEEGYNILNVFPDDEVWSDTPTEGGWATIVGKDRDTDQDIVYCARYEYVEDESLDFLLYYGETDAVKCYKSREDSPFPDSWVKIYMKGAGCNDRPCQNGGTCTPTDFQGGYSCECAPGWYGDDCSLTLDSLCDPWSNWGGCGGTCWGYPCIMPCGGCGRQFRTRTCPDEIPTGVGFTIEYNDQPCGVRQCRANLLREKYQIIGKGVKPNGRRITKYRSTYCCFEWFTTGRPVALGKRGGKPCHRPRVRGLIGRGKGIKRRGFKG